MLFSLQPLQHFWPRLPLTRREAPAVPQDRKCSRRVLSTVTLALLATHRVRKCRTRVRLKGHRAPRDMHRDTRPPAQARGDPTITIARQRTNIRTLIILQNPAPAG